MYEPFKNLYSDNKLQLKNSSLHIISIKLWIYNRMELICWLSALLFLYFMDPERDVISWCIFKIIGFNACPGCGIGHSIHAALHLQLALSINEHPFGIPAVFIMLNRIRLLIFFQNLKSTYDK